MEGGGCRGAERKAEQVVRLGLELGAEGFPGGVRATFTPPQGTQGPLLAPTQETAGAKQGGVTGSLSTGLPFEGQAPACDPRTTPPAT